MGLSTQFFHSYHDTSPLASLENPEGYHRLFMDADLWRPYVREVCQRHRLLPFTSFRPGLAGTCPTFVVNECWVVKFFGRLFDGRISFKVEQECARLLTESPVLPVPRLVGMGNLQDGFNEGWDWPYLIFQYLPGISFGEVYDLVPFREKIALARLLGEGTRGLHCLPLPADDMTGFISCYDFLRKQRLGCSERHRKWGSLPDHLLEDIDLFLQTTDDLPELFNSSGLIHADLTRDHILGRLENGAWQTMGIIDFGDAMIGNLPYDLVALHLDLFACEKRLLKAYLDAYGLDKESHEILPIMAMRTTLLHQFNVLDVLLDHLPQAHQAASIRELSRFVWDVRKIDD